MNNATDRHLVKEAISEAIVSAGANLKWAYFNDRILLGHISLEMTRKHDGYVKDITIAEVKMHFEFDHEYFVIRDLETVNGPYEVHKPLKSWMKINLADPEMCSQIKNAIAISKSVVNERYKTDQKRKRKRKAPEWL